MINSKIVNQHTEKKIILLNMIHVQLREIKSRRLIKLQRKSIIKKVQEIDIWLKKEAKGNRLIMNTKMKKNIIQVFKETKLRILVIDLGNLQTAIKTKKTKMLIKKSSLKNNLPASKKIQT